MALDPESIQKATPPPASRPRLAREQLLLVTALGGAAIAAMALLVPGTWAAYYALRLWLPLWVIVCLVYGGPMLESRNRWVTRITRVSRGSLAEWGGGAYAAIALVCFLWLEWAQVRELLVWIARTDRYTDKFGVRDIVRESVGNLVDFFLGSFMNGLHAFVWPAFWKKTFTAGQMWPAAVIGWGVFASGKWAIEHLARDAAPRRPGPGPAPGAGP